MITGEIKSKVDRIRSTPWSGGISNSLTIIEQLSYLHFIKRLDELHTLNECKANGYKEVFHETVEQDSPKKILIRFAKLEDEIAKCRSKLEGLLT
jgi:type I restriction enzyme M protein